MSIVRCCQRRNPLQGRFACRGEGSTDQKIDSQVRTCVDARDNRINFRYQRRNGCTNAINWRSIDRVPTRLMLANDQRAPRGDTMPAFTAATIGRDHRNRCRIRQYSSHRFVERSQTFCVDTVVIGQQNIQNQTDRRLRNPSIRSGQPPTPLFRPHLAPHRSATSADPTDATGFKGVGKQPTSV
ncbi:hypothetical protein Poly59_11330 [Rubripirellula reticaptiva]|uniref:Uncharacterized protein n=1 Tax=Rubripirellula reticaptiva TaxID=2528013 RepID=A0A5C6FBQ5_9BACT|nr:hypothetical protein Poly59_11330 [Rubripirellula reticaptiva]